MNHPRTRKEREVWQAINSLQADGLRIDDMTGEVIANRLLQLGFNRGSSTDIYRFKRSWLVINSMPQENQALSLASQLSDPITQAASALKEKITIEAQIEIKRIREQAEQRCQILQDALEAEQIKVEKILADHKQIRDKLTNTEYEVKKHRETLQITEQRLLDMVQKAEIQAIEVKHLQNENQTNADHFKINIASMQEQHTDFINVLQAAHNQAIGQIKEVMENQRHRTIVEIDTLQETVKKQQLLIEQQTKEQFILQTKINHHQDSEEVLQNKITELSLSLNLLEREKRQLNEIKNKTENEIANLRQFYTEHKNELIQKKYYLDEIKQIKIVLQQMKNATVSYEKEIYESIE